MAQNRVVVVLILLTAGVLTYAVFFSKPQEGKPIPPSPVSSSPKHESDNTAGTADFSPEEILAFAQTQKRGPENEPLVEEFSRILDSLQNKCGEQAKNRKGVAEVLLLCHKQLEEAGVKDTLLFTAQQIDASLPKEKMPHDLPSAAAVYVGLRKIENKQN